MLRLVSLKVLPGFAGVALLAANGCDRLATRKIDPDSVAEAYRYSTAALMWPGATRSFQVTPAGDFYNGEWATRFHPQSDGVPADSPRVIAYEGRWLPITRWVRHNGEVRWSFAAAALPEPSPRDSGLLVTLEITAANLGHASHEAGLEIQLTPPDSVPVFAAFDAPDAGPGALRWAVGADSDTAHGWVDRDGDVDAERRRLRWVRRLGPGQSRRLRLVLPAYPSRARNLRNWARIPHGFRLAEARRRWKSMLESGVRFELGDPEVEDALRAALVVLLGCRERRGPYWVPIGNPFQYRDVWLRDGARVITALAVTGFTREARELAAGFLPFQWPHGAFASQRGQPDGTGQALWAFDQALLRPEVAPSIQSFADAAHAAWTWLEWQRVVGRRMGGEYGVLHPFADPRDNENVRAQLVGSDVWSLSAYRSAARILRAAGRSAAADSVLASRRLYMLDFDEALVRSGSPDVPSSWQNIGRDWGNFAVTWPCGVLPASHPRCTAMARRAWAGRPGLTTIGGSDLLHTYVGVDLGVWALLVGERQAADRVLADMLHWRSASGGAAEAFVRSSRDYGRNLPPHTTAAAALVTFVRNALVFDDADTLMLTLGAREGWWRRGSVRGAPTRWGIVDIEFARRANEAVWRWTPVPVWTALALPPGTALAAAPSPPLRAAQDGRTVLAPPQTERATVTLKPEASP